MRVRIANRLKWTTVDRRAVADERLSFRARGVLIWLLDKPDNWSTDAESIAEHGKEGRDAVRAALRELTEFGYLKREKVRDATGRVTTVSTLYEVPADPWKPAAGETEPATGLPTTGNPPPGEPGGNTKTVNEDCKEEPLEPDGSKPKTRPRNEAWDALVAVFGWNPSGLTRSESTRLGKALREITAALPDDTQPIDVGRHITARAGRYRQCWPNAELTPEALVKHWSRFAPANGKQPQPGPVAASTGRLSEQESVAKEGRIKNREAWLRRAAGDESYIPDVPPPDPRDADYWDGPHGNDWRHGL